MSRHTIFPAVLVIGLLFTSLGGCRSRCDPPFVPVREEQFTMDFQLPFDPEKTGLAAFLGAGCNKSIAKRGDLVDPAAKKSYSELLELVARRPVITWKEIKDKDGKLWRLFPEAPVRQVVDARAKRPSSPHPFAWNDGQNCWWIFHSDGRLVVTKAKMKPKERIGR